MGCRESHSCPAKRLAVALVHFMMRVMVESGASDTMALVDKFASYLWAESKSSHPTHIAQEGSVLGSARGRL